MTGLVLLASYPKSGNTWLRAFLASLDAGGSVPDINRMDGIATFALRTRCDAAIGLETADLTAQEIARVRPWINRRLAAGAGAGTMVKVHDANLVAPGGSSVPFPPEIVARAVFLVRDPRDLVLSGAHHFGRTPEAIVAQMADPDFRMGGPGDGNVEQYVSSWTAHGESWLAVADYPVHVLRYEDMMADPGASFRAVAGFLGRGEDDETIDRAVASVAFGNLAAQEVGAGFRERHRSSDAPFFRKGCAGAWRTDLSPHLADRIDADHGEAMRRFGYDDGPLARFRNW